jgi:uncharacterized protein with von Willebrand factor type A (vWA) domain
MFLPFFYLLRSRGLKVSVHEWLSLMDAISQGLVRASFTNFYHLLRATLVKREADFDKLDAAFLEYFEGIQSPEDIPEEFLKWLAQDELERDINDKKVLDDYVRELEELLQIFEERKAEQREKHSGGNYWIGTGGTSTMGRGGYNPAGIRVGGTSRHKTALQVAGERKFKDFRDDRELDIRSFQVALRKLRQYSARVDTGERELDIDETIEETSDNAGLLKIVYKKPRKNTVKLLLLFDSDGSMYAHRDLTNKLFQAVSKENRFKDLKVYYFHNAIYEHIYTDPYCRRGAWVETEWLMKNLGPEYKVIFIGDAAMAPSELLRPGGNVYIGLWNEEPGIKWLRRLKKHYANSIWLNPIPEADWDWTYGSETIKIVGDTVPMYPLTVEGIEAGIKELLVASG